jgi:hypothetical protein
MEGGTQRSAIRKRDVFKDSGQQSENMMLSARFVKSRLLATLDRAKATRLDKL